MNSVNLQGEYKVSVITVFLHKTCCYTALIDCRVEYGNDTFFLYLIKNIEPMDGRLSNPEIFTENLRSLKKSMEGFF